MKYVLHLHGGAQLNVLQGIGWRQHTLTVFGTIRRECFGLTNQLPRSRPTQPHKTPTHHTRTQEHNNSTRFFSSSSALGLCFCEGQLELADIWFLEVEHVPVKQLQCTVGVARGVEGHEAQVRVANHVRHLVGREPHLLKTRTRPEDVCTPVHKWARGDSSTPPEHSAITE